MVLMQIYYAAMKGELYEDLLKDLLQCLFPCLVSILIYSLVLTKNDFLVKGFSLINYKQNPCNIF